METGTTGNLTGSAVIWSAFANEALQAVFDLRWMIVFSLVLIAVDFWWGCRESKMRFVRYGDERNKIRKSRAGRRTVNKLVDYLSYLLIGCVLGLAITEPLGLMGHTATAAIGLGAGCLFEVDSIIDHVCYVHGIEKRFNVWKFAKAWVASRWKGFGHAIDEGLGEGEGHEHHHHHFNENEEEDETETDSEV